MKVEGVHRRTIEPADDGDVLIIDQRQLPDRFVMARISSVEEMARAIREMWLRGAPLIGVAAAYGVALACRRDPGDPALAAAEQLLLATRPTAVNLSWAVGDLRRTLAPLPPAERAAAAYARAGELAEADVEQCRRIGEHGVALLAPRGRPVQVLTHCNAGWLATVDWGTALAPVYLAHARGVDVHVWVSETRPRQQGALTAWELAQEGIAHTVIVDNAAGHLLQRGQVDLCLVGSDRTSARGDVANKIGTYLKALAARAHDVPFYAAVPGTSIDWRIEDGIAGIPIEERDPREVSERSPAHNPAFDVTPAALVTGIITERGIAPATAAGLRALFPENAR